MPEGGRPTAPEGSQVSHTVGFPPSLPPGEGRPSARGHRPAGVAGESGAPAGSPVRFQLARYPLSGGRATLARDPDDVHQLLAEHLGALEVLLAPEPIGWRFVSDQARDRLRGALACLEILRRQRAGKVDR